MIKLFKYKVWVYLMAPFSLIYKWVMQLRNHLYNIAHKPAFEFDNLVIAVGNLSVGGTGKTPMVEYLIKFFISQKQNIPLTTLSRGYGRKSKGFIMADDQTNATEIGDEPYQMYHKFDSLINVAVCEDRVLAVPSILLEHPENKVILLDDAFQHRSIKPNFSIVLSAYSRPFYNDYVLPSGLLREARHGINRADILIITKCPENLKKQEMEAIKQRASKYFQKPAIYFSGIRYDEIRSKLTRNMKQKVVALTGIAQPAVMVNYLAQSFEVAKHFDYPDHHQFTLKEMETINEYATQQQADILCTEKDWVRIISNDSLHQLVKDKLFYLPMMVQFLEGEQALLNKLSHLLVSHNLNSDHSTEIN